MHRESLAAESGLERAKFKMFLEKQRQRCWSRSLGRSLLQSTGLSEEGPRAAEMPPRFLALLHFSHQSREKGQERGGGRRAFTSPLGEEKQGGVGVGKPEHGEMILSRLALV